MAGCKEEKGELRLDGLEGGGDVEEEEETGSVVERATLVRGRKEEEAIKAARWLGEGVGVGDGYFWNVGHP